MNAKGRALILALVLCVGLSQRIAAQEHDPWVNPYAMSQWVEVQGLFAQLQHTPCGTGILSWASEGRALTNAELNTNFRLIGQRALREHDITLRGEQPITVAEFTRNVAITRELVQQCMPASTERRKYP